MLIYYYFLFFFLLHVYIRNKEVPVGVMFNKVKESSSGFLRRISAATGSGCIPCRLVDLL
jgi:hypothetical protein